MAAVETYGKFPTFLFKVFSFRIGLSDQFVLFRFNLFLDVHFFIQKSEITNFELIMNGPGEKLVCTVMGGERRNKG